MSARDTARRPRARRRAHPRPHHRALPFLVLAAIAALALVVVTPARGALPSRHGGRLTLPAPELVTEIDPAQADTPFEAALAEAVFDGLYEIRDGEVVPVLAAGPPEVEGTVATIRLREGVRHHGGGELRAGQVVRALLRTSTGPSAWLLGAFETDEAGSGRPAITEVDDHTIRIQLARRGVRVDAVLAAAPLAIVVGGNLRRAPLGTGPFHARLDGAGGVDLRIFRRSPGGPPWLDRVRFERPTSRDDEIRAFELGRLDGSWRGRTLYGGEPTRPLSTARSSASTPMILVPNRARGLSDDAAWGAVAHAIDRRRFERLGLSPRASLGAGLPAPTVPSAGSGRGLTLRMPVRASRATEVGAAEALASMLDEHGIRLEVDRVTEAAYRSRVDGGAWDLRLASVRPPLPGVGPLAGAALAAAGQTDRARSLAPTLGHREVAAEVARDLGALVLGHERVVLHHRADLEGVAFDRGRLELADLSFARPRVALREPHGGAR